MPTLGVRLSLARASNSSAVAFSDRAWRSLRPGSGRPARRARISWWRSGLICWRSSSSRSRAAMASRESSQRGDLGGDRRPERLGPRRDRRRRRRAGPAASVLHWSTGRRENRGAAARAPLRKTHWRRRAGPAPGHGRAPGSGACPPWHAAAPAAGSSATRDKTASASRILAGLEQEAAAAQPIGGRLSGLPQRGRPIGGPHHLGTGLGGLARGRISVSQRIPDFRRLLRIGHEPALARSSSASLRSGDVPPRSSLIQPKQVGLDLEPLGAGGQCRAVEPGESAPSRVP